MVRAPLCVHPINNLSLGVYAFGFLFMLPQLFVNYKVFHISLMMIYLFFVQLKSVAHLPWRAFMYKVCEPDPLSIFTSYIQAFNTFIDDVFAFIITMPTSHRIAVFRDDLVFLVYLYQRW